MPDTVDILHASHYEAAENLKIIAVSSDPNALLTVWDHTRNVFIGTIPDPGGGPASFHYEPYPPQVRVESTSGGQAIADVEQNP